MAAILDFAFKWWVQVEQDLYPSFKRDFPRWPTILDKIRKLFIKTPKCRIFSRKFAQWFLHRIQSYSYKITRIYTRNACKNQDGRLFIVFLSQYVFVVFPVVAYEGFLAKCNNIYWESSIIVMSSGFESNYQSRNKEKEVSKMASSNKAYFSKYNWKAYLILWNKLAGLFSGLTCNIRCILT